MSSDCGPGKSSWPELVGMTGQVAVATIERENPNVDAIVVPQGQEAPGPGDFNCNRVFVFLHQGRVIEVPVIG